MPPRRLDASASAPSPRTWARALILTLAGLSPAACQKGGGSDARAAAEQADRTWSIRCARCHGANGNGNGPQAIALNPKPRSLRDPKWQAQTSDERIRKVITGGGGAVGLSLLMPAHPDLARDAAQLEAMVRKVRSMVQ